MTDANQVRINELARELEVKAKAIIDLLPGYGVTEKKTHSSSIPADVAEKVRKKILGAAEEEAQAEAAAKAEKEAKEAAAKAARLRPAAPVAPPQASVAPAAVKPSAPASPAAPAAKPGAPAAPTATAPAAPKALTPTPAPAVLPPAEKPAAPAAAAPKPIPIRPAPAGAPATPAGARPPAIVLQLPRLGPFLDAPAVWQDRERPLGHYPQEIAVQCLRGQRAIADHFLTRAENRAPADHVPDSPCVRSNRARDGHSPRDRGPLAVLVDRNPAHLSNAAVRCRQAHGPARVRPGVRECCRRFQRNCLPRRSRASRSIRENRPSASAPFWTSASKKVSANCIRRGSVRGPAEARPLRLSPRRSPARRGM